MHSFSSHFILNRISKNVEIGQIVRVQQGKKWDHLTQGPAFINRRSHLAQLCERAIVVELNPLGQNCMTRAWSFVRWKCPPLGRTCRARAGGAPPWRRRRKKMQGMGALWESGHGCFAGGGRTLHTCFGGGGRKSISWCTRIVRRPPAAVASCQSSNELWLVAPIFRCSSTARRRHSRSRRAALCARLPACPYSPVPGSRNTFRAMRAWQGLDDSRCELIPA